MESTFKLNSDACASELGTCEPAAPTLAAFESFASKFLFVGKSWPLVRSGLVAILILLCLGITSAEAAPARKSTKLLSSEQALNQATENYRSLQNDKKGRLRRDLWMKVIKDLELAGQRAGQGKTAALAYMRAAMAAQELASISYLQADHELAESYFTRVSSCCISDSLADDALLAAARLNMDVLGRTELARSQLERAISLQGDMKKPAEVLLSTLPPPPQKPEELELASEAWEQLKANSARRVYREPWLGVISNLKKAAGPAGCQGRADVALMRAARAHVDLARISGSSMDAKAAEEAFVQVARRCPNSTLADDALLEAAEVANDRLSDVALARKHLEETISIRGDMEALARARLRQLPSVPTTSSLETKTAKEIPPSTAASPTTQVSHKTGSALGSQDEEGLEALITRSELARVLKSQNGEARNSKASDSRTARKGGENEAAGLLQRGASGSQSGNQSGKQSASTKDSDGRVDLAALIPEPSDPGALDDEVPSLSEQVGLKVRRIIIDAGHGGKDPGAVGRSGVKEKDVTLAMAKRLSALLRAKGYETVLTREKDVYLALEERTAIANREKGDLFISIHANANEKRDRKGIETYYLNIASDRFAMRLAARENAASEKSISDLEYLLADLAMRNNTQDSARLAGSVQQSLVGHVKQRHGAVRDLGVKHALFYVLLGAKMPAVLIETAFISNPVEEKWLASEAFQDTVAKAIAQGIDNFVDRRVQLASSGR